MPRYLFGLLVASACSFGPRVKTFAPIRGPQGAVTKVTRGRTYFDAELLAVTDTAFLLLNTASTRVVLVPYTAATAVSFPQLPAGYAVRRGHPPSTSVREQLRLWSRFPAGVSAALLPQLLSAYGQDSLVVLASCTAPGC